MSAAQPATSKIADFDAITIVMNLYTQGVRTGSSAAMKPAFHDAATFFGYYQGQLLAGPIQILFDWSTAMDLPKASRPASHQLICARPSPW